MIKNKTHVTFPAGSPIGTPSGSGSTRGDVKKKLRNHTLSLPLLHRLANRDARWVRVRFRVVVLWKT
jgi:hypothetical protein